MPRERVQHGKPIGKHQLVQEHLAAIEMARLASDAIVTKAAQAKDSSNDDADNAELKRQADLLAAQAKLFAANAAWDAADRAVQILGGRGWSTLYRPGRHLQDVRVCRIYEGTDEILKLKIAARGCWAARSGRRSTPTTTYFTPLLPPPPPPPPATRPRPKQKPTPRGPAVGVKDQKTSEVR